MTTPRTADVRKWAREQGMATADRGRLPLNVLQAYEAAHAGKTGGASATGPSAGSPKPGPKASTRKTATSRAQAARKAEGTRKAGAARKPEATRKAEASSEPKASKAKAKASRAAPRVKASTEAKPTPQAQAAKVGTVGPAVSLPTTTPSPRDAVAPAVQPVGRDVEERLQQVEGQLADALSRLTALESRTLRSLLGLRITL